MRPHICTKRFTGVHTASTGNILPLHSCLCEIAFLAGAVIETLHLWPGGPGFKPVSL
uniref:Uncharacterized protein n=1 Tax=Arundo donax TaxID=35708 RepID=A0A0A9CRZ6_ARUDO